MIESIHYQKQWKSSEYIKLFFKLYSKIEQNDFFSKHSTAQQTVFIV